MKDSFWMVWGGVMPARPTYKHDSLQNAKTEAARLAQLHRGEVFVVLQSVGECSMPPAPAPEWIEHEDEIPF